MHTEKLSAARGMSYAEFLEWCDEDTLAEWVDGEVIMASPASAVHQILVGFLLKSPRIPTRSNTSWARSSPRRSR